MEPGLRPYRPVGACLDLFYCRETEILLEGPAGTGKSRAALEKLFLCCQRYPGMRALIVRKTRTSCTESILQTFEAKVVPERHPLLAGAHRSNRAAYALQNEASIVVGGMDHPDRIMSTEYDLIYAAEAKELTESDWEALLSRLRNNVMPYQQAIADTNPDAPGHWLHRRANDGKMARLCSRHEDNPLLYREGRWMPFGLSYMKRLDRLTGVRLARLRWGKWVAAEGMVYQDAWDSAVNIIDRFEVPPDWRRIRSIDFGYTNPFVCQWWAIDPDGRMYLYRELYGSRRIVDDWATDILRLSERERIETSIADHDAGDRAVLEKRGIATLAAMKSVTIGIEAVRTRMRKAGDGKPRLYIMRDATPDRDLGLCDSGRPASTAEEIEAYVYPPTKERRAEKEEPVKDNDHGMDAMRYAVAYVDAVGPGVLSDVRLIGGRKMRGEDEGWV